MKRSNTGAIAALTAAGVLWGSSMALSKLSLEWLQPGWLTVIRFGLAALLLAFPARAHLRAAFTPTILVWGVLGVGVTVVVQNVGVGLTSVSHASMMVGSMPVLVAVIAAVWHRHRLPVQAWAGLAISLVGVGVVAGGGGGQSSLIGDALVLFSLAISAAMTVAQVDMLRGRDPMAVTAVQFMAAAAGRPADRPADRGCSGGSVVGRPDPRRPRPDRGRDDAAVGLLRLRPGPGAGCRGGVVPQHRAARRCGPGRCVLR